MTRRKEHIELSEEALQKQRERRAADERRLKADRALVLHSFLHKHGSGGLLVVEGVPDDVVKNFREGFEIELGKRLLMLSAEGTIQGSQQDEGTSEETLQALSQHRREHKAKGVIGFEGVDFSGDSGSGTPLIANRVHELIMDTRKVPRKTPAIVAFGTGKPSDMPTSPLYSPREDRGVINELQVILALDKDGEARTLLPSPADSMAYRPSPYPPITEGARVHTHPGMGLN